MSIRLYENFMKKAALGGNHNVNKKFKAFSDEEHKDLCIAIPLKGGKGKAIELSENFVKVIEHEYAVRYLEHMGINPTIKMISNLL